MKWIIWCNVTLGDALGRYFRNTSEWAPAEQHNAKAGEIAKGELEAGLRVLDSALEGRDYLVGDSFTLADLHLAAWVGNLGFVKLDLSPSPAIAAWRARCPARPAHARVQLHPALGRTGRGASSPRRRISGSAVRAAALACRGVVR
jgi:glutathione S-transferase